MKKILFCMIALCLCGCREVEYDELWREKVELPDGTHCMVYHTHDCPNDKPFFLCKEKKYDYRKMKFDVFDYCVEEEEVIILNLISERNIRRELESPYICDAYNYFSLVKRMYDMSKRGYEVYYSVDDKGELHELEKSRSGFSLSNQK